MNRRKGFSLIELLIVMTIMALVLGLIYRATIGTTDAGRVSSTKTTIAKLDSILDERIAALEKQSIRNAAVAFVSAYNNGGNGVPSDPNEIESTSIPVASAFMQKLRFRSTFPQRLEDLYGLDETPNTADDAYLLSVWLTKTGGVLLPSGHDRKHESSKLLYLALMENQTQMTDSVNPRHVAYLDPPDKEMGLASFVDDWGNALRFYNWPTRLIRPGGHGAAIEQNVFLNTAKPLTGIELPKTPTPIPFPSIATTAGRINVNQDPSDPMMALAAARYRRDFNTEHAADPNFFENPFGLAGWIPSYRRSSTNTASAPAVSGTFPPITEANYHTLLTLHRPMIVSCGSDGELGLEEPTAAGPLRLGMPKTGEEEYIADDITNLQRRI